MTMPSCESCKILFWFVKRLKQMNITIYVSARTQGGRCDQKQDEEKSGSARIVSKVERITLSL